MLSPLAVPMGISTLYFMVRGESHGFSKDVGFGFGWFGLLGLIGTILIPVSILRKRKWMRLLMTILIGCGFLAAAAMMLEPGDASSSNSMWSLWTAWMLGGPVIVGVWNLSRMWSQPNQSLQHNDPSCHVS